MVAHFFKRFNLYFPGNLYFQIPGKWNAWPYRLWRNFTDYLRNYRNRFCNKPFENTSRLDMANGRRIAGYYFSADFTFKYWINRDHPALCIRSLWNIDRDILDDAVFLFQKERISLLDGRFRCRISEFVDWIDYILRTGTHRSDYCWDYWHYVYVAGFFSPVVFAGNQRWQQKQTHFDQRRKSMTKPMIEAY